MPSDPLNLDNRTFRPIQISSGGDVDRDTVFHYRQQGELVWGTYQGGRVRFGTLIAAVRSDGRLDMRYQQVTADGEIKTGSCVSTPHVLPDGRLRFHERWTWTEGGSGSGESWIEETGQSETSDTPRGT